jgi:enamine deaminase RidA (YjgF/YER057c/UK114 family)
MLLPSLALLFLTITTVAASATADAVRQVRPDDAAGTSAAVVVDGAANLAHTEQILPIDADGKVIAPNQAAGQAAAVLDRLEAILKGVESGIDRLVKVDVYIARPDAVATFQQAFARRMAGKARPAVTYVVVALPRPEALVALDAIAVTAVSGTRPNARVAVLPAGPRILISGQTEPDADLVTATRKTLAGLGDTLKYVGSDRSQVVRCKAFMQPMTAAAAADVEREVSAFFGGEDVPPLSLVEWRSSQTQPIEIELVAATREQGAGPLEYLTPPALKSSPVFSRVARVNASPLIFVSGLYGSPGTTGAAQVEAIFDTLGKVLAECGSDLRNMAKATYYVADDATTRALGEFRQRHYDPNRPPAASKALVAGVGAEGRTITLDMIAVPAAK